MLAQWLSSDAARAQQHRLRLFVDCSCCAGWRIHLFNNNNAQAAQNRPFLVVRTEPRHTKRVRRRAMDCSPESGSQCCKQR